MTGKSYFHRGGDTPLLGETIPEHFARIVKQFPDNEAIVSIPQNRRLSYRELAEETDRVAKGLLAFGFGKGDRLGVWSTNNIEWLLLQLATARIGVVLVNINPAYRPRELAYALQRSEVECVVTIPSFRTSDYVAMLAELVPELTSSKPGDFKNDELPFLEHVILYDPADPDKTQRPHPGFDTWPELLAAGERVKQESLELASAELDIDDPINIQYTSGTTGFPKAVVLTHHNILNNGWFTARAMHFTDKDRLCIPVPFYHCFGMVMGNLGCTSHGATMVIPGDAFDPGAVLEAVQDFAQTLRPDFPSHFGQLLGRRGAHHPAREREHRRPGREPLAGRRRGDPGGHHHRAPARRRPDGGRGGPDLDRRRRHDPGRSPER